MYEDSIDLVIENITDMFEKEDIQSIIDRLQGFIDDLCDECGSNIESCSCED